MEPCIVTLVTQTKCTATQDAALRTPCDHAWEPWSRLHLSSIFSCTNTRTPACIPPCAGMCTLWYCPSTLCLGFGIWELGCALYSPPTSLACKQRRGKGRKKTLSLSHILTHSLSYRVHIQSDHQGLPDSATRQADRSTHSPFTRHTLRSYDIYAALDRRSFTLPPRFRASTHG